MRASSFLGLLLFWYSKTSLQKSDDTAVITQEEFLAQEDECSASKPCELGCCSEAGHCGYGPKFCGDGCINSCKRKSECNPGWEGDEWSEVKTCPLNVCCSEFGFCGTTKDYCGDDKVQRPSCSSTTPIKRVIGYYEAWSLTERLCYGMLPEEIPYGYYTHINFAFATIHPSTFQLTPGNSRTADFMERIQSLKLIQPDLQIWVAVGGWTFNDPGPTATTFSDIARSTEAQEAFIDSVISIMNTYDFDGLDLDWEYPVAEDRNGRKEDFDNFVTLMRRMRQKLNDKGMSHKGLSLTLPSSYWYMKHFDIVKLEKYVDWFNIMSYDVHGSWDIDNKHTGPWVNSHTNMTEIQDALDLLWRNKIKPEKVVMGHGFYSRSFALADAGCSEPGCRVVSGGNGGRCSKTTGVLLHTEIQEIIKAKGLTPKLYRDATYKAVHWDDQWASFDDLATWRLKNNIFRSQCISGIMVWAASQDDKDSTNLKALVSSVDRKVMDTPGFVDKPTVKPDPAFLAANKSCTWTGCGQECPSGYKLIWRESKPKEIFGDGCTVGGMKKLCCPASQELPKCEWRGHKNSGSCKAGCNMDEVELGGTRVGCKSGYQSACCTYTESTKAWRSCAWTTGDCELGEKQTCPAGRPERVAGAAWGWGSINPCGWGESERGYCCLDTPADFKNCTWITDAENRKGKYCDACRDDQINIAMRYTSECLTPYEALCCDRPVDTRENDDPANDPSGTATAKLLKEAIKSYMDNPTCPATVLEPPIPDVFQRRSLVLEAAEKNCDNDNTDGLSKAQLARRGADCYLRVWNVLKDLATRMILNRGVYMDSLVQIWDDGFAGPLDEQYQIGNLRNFSDLYPENDPAHTVVTVLYNPLDAGEQLRRARLWSAHVCMWPVGTTSRKRDGSHLHEPSSSDLAVLGERAIWTYGGKDSDLNRNDVPNLRTILLGIAQGVLALHYARWTWYRAGTGSGNRNPGPMLEIAYWVGPDPGLTPENPSTYDRYRDVREGHSTDPDRWVVFHFYFDPLLPGWIREFDGNIYMGATAVTVFHGQSAELGTYDREDWRVSNGGGTFGESSSERTRRTIINCRRLRTEAMWYIGYQVNLPQSVRGETRRWMQAMQDWGTSLYTAGYVGPQAYELIYPSAGNPGLDGVVNAGAPRGELTMVRQLADANGARGWTWFSNWYINAEGNLVRSPSSTPPQLPGPTSTGGAAKMADATAAAVAA